MRTTYIQWLLVASSNTFNFNLYLFYEVYVYPVATSSLPKYFYIMWLSNVSILSVSDDRYSRNVLCALNFISTFFLQLKHHYC